MITGTVADNLLVNRGNIVTQNAIARRISNDLLRGGEVEKSQWPEAFAVLGPENKAANITSAMVGEINKGNITNEQELAEQIVMAMEEFYAPK